MIDQKKVLIYGYGNPGRQDDGLGAAFISMMEEHLKSFPIEGLTLDCNYQLNIEDAELISSYDIVLFVDATQEDISHFKITKVNPSESKIEFTMHAVSVAYVLDLCSKIYNKLPTTYLLHIRGYEWEFKEELTAYAKQNLQLAFKFVIENWRNLMEKGQIN